MHEYRVCMGIDEAGQHHAPAAIDLNNLLTILLKPSIAQRVLSGANRNNFPAEAEHSSVLNDSELGKGSTAARAVCR